jgi:hypothetical protein
LLVIPWIASIYLVCACTSSAAVQGSVCEHTLHIIGLLQGEMLVQLATAITGRMICQSCLHKLLNLLCNLASSSRLHS